MLKSLAHVLFIYFFVAVQSLHGNKYYKPSSKECFDAWSEVYGKTPSSYEDIINEIMWNNKFLCHDKKSMYRIDIVNLGLGKIRDLISANNSFSCDFSSFTILNKDFFS